MPGLTRTMPGKAEPNAIKKCPFVRRASHQRHFTPDFVALMSGSDDLFGQTQVLASVGLRVGHRLGAVMIARREMERLIKGVIKR